MPGPRPKPAGLPPAAVIAATTVTVAPTDDDSEAAAVIGVAIIRIRRVVRIRVWRGSRPAVEFRVHRRALVILRFYIPEGLRGASGRDRDGRFDRERQRALGVDYCRVIPRQQHAGN